MRGRVLEEAQVPGKTAGSPVDTVFEEQLKSKHSYLCGGTPTHTYMMTSWFSLLLNALGTRTLSLKAQHCDLCVQHIVCHLE